MRLILQCFLCMTALAAVGAQTSAPQSKYTKSDSKVKETSSKHMNDADVAKEEALKAQIASKPVTPIDGSIVHYEEFPSQHIRPRPVDVWLPEGYDANASDRYPVIYMHDGQMMFHVSTSPFAGMDVFWDVDKAITRLVREDEIRPAIVVSVWMADWTKGARGAEYMPQKPVTDETWQLMKERGQSFAVEEGGEVIGSDNYLKFLVEELKPFIDETYATQSDRGNTFVMGSSMGGLISAYAIAEYPDTFGGAACMSSHWIIGDGVVVQWLNNHWPSAGAHRVYFDHGTETFDATYEPYQKQMDEVMRRHGYTDGDDWTTLRFDGADHSPRAWRERLHVPLKFLLGR
jgi:predicted alpha/beta superfamily hydrolase